MNDNKKKQIEKMRKDLVEIFDEEYEKRRLITAENTAEKMTAKGYRKQEWVSVEERLPHWSDGKVLVFTKYGFSICERTVNSRWQGQHANWITHWMPLPEAPKMKGGEIND